MDVFDLLDSGDAARVRAHLAADPAAAGRRNAEGLDPVLYATYRMRPDLAAAVLEAGPELDVFTASAVGDAARVAALLDAEPGLAGAVARDGYTPLHLAAFFRHAGVARLLLDRGADPEAVAANPSGVRPLHSAAAGRAADVARLLLDAGAEPDPRQAGGYTPLMAAAQNGDAELAALLTARGADPDLRDDAGVSAADRMA